MLIGFFDFLFEVFVVCSVNESVFVGVRVFCFSRYNYDYFLRYMVEFFSFFVGFFNIWLE